MNDKFLKKLAKYDGDKFLKKVTANQEPPAWLRQASGPGSVSGNQVTGFGSCKGSNMNLAQTAASGRAKTNIVRLVANQMKLQTSQVYGSIQFSQPETYLQQNADGTFTAYARVIVPLPSIQVSKPSATVQQQAAAQQPATGNQPQSQRTNLQTPAQPAPNQGKAVQKNNDVSDEVKRQRRERALNILRQEDKPADEEMSNRFGNVAGLNTANINAGRDGNVRQNAQSAFDELDQQKFQ